MTKREPVVMQVYCRVEVSIEDPAAVAELAVRRLREAEIDWADEPGTLEQGEQELRADLPQALAGLVDPLVMFRDVPGVDLRGARLWAEGGSPDPRFQPGF
ncbi:hypothetical protein [Actinoplanes siamensis]|uniref:hypothetical protein n=1 Tax=Actinoplanes siamensis TaxID=1223317 RepID=UPI0019432BA8|nr:hypothetical protein [Actinoplanes siamensis]